MEDRNHDDTSDWETEPFPSFYSSDSPSTQSPASSQSEKSSPTDQRTLGSESPPDLAATRCRGRASGCSYPEDAQPHCHMRCPPRACKQCREVLDADWIEKGRWVEDCVSIAPGDEERPGVPVRLVLKVVGAGAIAAWAAAVVWCVWRACADCDLLQQWAADWAQY